MPCKQLWVRSSREIDTSEMPERISRMTPAAQPPATEKRQDAKLHASLHLGSRKFTALVSCIVSINVTDAFFIAVYTTKLLLKLYVAPIAYWKSGYNILDATILLITFLPHVLPVDTTTCTHLEGTNQRSPDPSRTQAHQVQQRDEAVSGAWGLTRNPAVWHWQDLTQKYEQDCKAVKAAAVWAKKQKILEKQEKNVSDLVTLEQHKITQGEDFSELLDDIKKTLCHSDIIIMKRFYFTIPFIDLYLPFLDL
ncbi:cation channel sperm-associated protein 3 [Grus japonensis]|uniref:Cation channel sperm-associated protein 3 n=1 Tax=Grus japonensis TaxID=30415 RepID=A0ABC9XFJ0_GRUJA